MDSLATIDGLTRVNTRARRPFARYCGALLTLGMLVTDGLNGLWISRLIAAFAFAFALAKLTLPHVDAWADGKELLFGGAVVTIVLMSYILGKRLAHERPAHD